MKAKLLLSLVLVYSISAMPQNRQVRQTVQPVTATRPQIAQTNRILPIRRVILYSNGMVYIERRGLISGNADINLSFKQSQVDDVLKSMVVLDLGKGEIGAVSYNSSVPPSAQTAEIPFNIESATENNTGGMAGVLSQLQGAKVLVSAGK